MHIDEVNIGIVGLGYVGLPLAVEFAKHFSVVAFDINGERISQLKNGVDVTKEIDPERLIGNANLRFTDDQRDLAKCNVYIITVPTPIDQYKRPDLNMLKTASATIGSILETDNVVIFESTVYPGATEEECVPVLEESSGLRLNEDFYVGYSPERINPGDKHRKLCDIKKVTSGSCSEAAEFIDELYLKIVNAGTHRASSIMVAEAAKVIENTQRDVNIALMNELAVLFEKLELNTLEVLEAAGTKWNFLPFRPGLVGGHCIGVDPYYLTHKAQSVGHHPEMILAGRRINDQMPKQISASLVKHMIRRSIRVDQAKILIMGLTFKENCPDVRNTKVIDIVNDLRDYGLSVDVMDPWCNKNEVSNIFRGNFVEAIEEDQYDVILVAVAHDQFREMSIKEIASWGKKNYFIYDIKYLFPEGASVIHA